MTEEQRCPSPARPSPEGLPILERGGGVARRSKIHEGYSSSSRLAATTNLWQRNRFLFMRWVLEKTPRALPQYLSSVKDAKSFLASGNARGICSSYGTER